ncbi:MAG: DNA helicase II, partial [Rhodocyclaceae bacterium]|nr:DNA helicase II [Rhodocyclaceae bacterium]
RRLMYVAVTRAGARLYLSFAQSRLLHGQVRYGVPSRFIKEIPDSLTKWITPRRADAARSAPDYAPAPRKPVHKPAPRKPQAPAESESESDAPWRAGQLVQHTRFGRGVIIAVEGAGAHCKLQINFGDHGVKWLQAAIAAAYMAAL